MNKKMAEDISGIFRGIGIEATAKSRTGKPESWAVSFLIAPDKKDDLEGVLQDYADLKINVEYEPHGIDKERVLIY